MSEPKALSFHVPAPAVRPGGTPDFTDVQISRAGEVDRPPVDVAPEKIRELAYKIIRETFTSRVMLDRPNLKILVEYLNGPFKRMQNRWTFHPVGEDTCDVEFFIEYEFRSRALAMLMGAMFDAAFRKFSAAFEKRADKVYGHKTA